MIKVYYNILGNLAKRYLSKTKPYVIGVNGSVGKTTCRNIIGQTIEKFIADKKVYSSELDVNGKIGLILSIFGIGDFLPKNLYFLGVFFVAIYRYFFTKNLYDILVLEYGIEKPGDMEWMIDIVRPNISVFTTVDYVNLHSFQDPSEIAKEELKLTKKTSEIVFLNMDDIYTPQVLQDIEIDKFTYQTLGHESKADIRFENEKIYKLDSDSSGEKQNILVRFDLFLRTKKITIQTNALGKPSYGYIGVALMITDILKYKFTGNILKESEYNLKYILKPGRFDVYQGLDNHWFVDASYKISPLSVRKILNTVHLVQKEILSDHKVWLVLSDMENLQSLAEKEHRLIASYVQQTAEKVFLIGENMTNFLADELEKLGYDMTGVYKFHRSEGAEVIVRKMTGEEGKRIVVRMIK